MNTLAKRLDPTRKTTVAMYPARAGGIVKHSKEYRMEENIIPPELARHTEVASFNYCWEDYDKYMKYAPHMILYQSEATTNELGIAGKVDTLWWNDIVVGQTRVSSHWNREAGQKYKVYTYTNGDEVELFVNGRSLGIKQNSDKRKPNVIVWDGVQYEPGTIKAIARKGGKMYAEHQLETAGKAVRLIMQTEIPAWKADGMGLQYVKVYAVDAKGRIVPTYDGNVTFKVEGPARIIAVDNGNHSSDDLFDGNEKQLYEGFAMAILRSSKDQAGKVKITATCNGLKSATKTIETMM